MATINKHIIVGNIGKKPVLRIAQSGMSICGFSVATQDGPKGQDGKPTANWHKFVAFDKKAEFVASYLDQGTTVYVEGPCKLKTYQDKAGNTRYDKETIVDRIEPLSRVRRDDSPPAQRYASASGYGGGSSGPQHISQAMPFLPQPPANPTAGAGYAQPANPQTPPALQPQGQPGYSQPNPPQPPPGHPAAQSVPDNAVPAGPQTGAYPPPDAPPAPTYSGEEDLPF